MKDKLFAYNIEDGEFHVYATFVDNKIFDTQVKLDMLWTAKVTYSWKTWSVFRCRRGNVSHETRTGTTKKNILHTSNIFYFSFSSTPFSLPCHKYKSQRIAGS